MAENTVETLKTLITDPAGGVAMGKKTNAANTAIVLVVDWVVAAIAVMVASQAAAISLSGTPLGSFSGLADAVGGIAAAGVLVGGVLVTLFSAFLLYWALRALGGKGGFWEGLNALVYAIWPLSLGSLVVSALLFGGLGGAFIGFLVLAILGVSSLAILFRAVKEYFGVDYLTAFIALGILGGGLAIAGLVASAAAVASLSTAFLKLFTQLGAGSGLQQLFLLGTSGLAG